MRDVLTSLISRTWWPYAEESRLYVDKCRHLEVVGDPDRHPLVRVDWKVDETGWEATLLFDDPREEDDEEMAYNSWWLLNYALEKAYGERW